MKKQWYALKYPGIILSIMLLFQSCGVFYKNPIPLEEAAATEGKVKIRTTDGKIIRYRKITSTDGRFYGTKMKAGKWTQIPITQDSIVSLRLKNKKASTWVTVLAVGIPFAALMLWAATADYGIGGIGW